MRLPLLALEDRNSRAPNKSWHQNVVGNEAEKSGVRLRGWLWNAMDGISGLPLDRCLSGCGLQPCKIIWRSGLPGWNIIHSGQQGWWGQPHEGREHGLSHIGAQRYRGIEVLGYQDIEISGYQDNRISGFRGWQACGIGRACGVVKAGRTGGVGRAGGGSKAGKAGRAGKLGELGELGELEARAGDESSPA